VGDGQTRSIIRQVGLALPSHREMPSLLQSPHSQTETETHPLFVIFFLYNFFYSPWTRGQAKKQRETGPG